MDTLAATARQYHRSKETADLMMRLVLPRLCSVILDHPSAVAATRCGMVLDGRFTHIQKFVLVVFRCQRYLSLYIYRDCFCLDSSHHLKVFSQLANSSPLTSQGISNDGQRFWGEARTYSRRRTVFDVLLMVYHDAAESLLHGSDG